MSDNRSLLDIAITNYDVANELYRMKTDDPIRLNIIGYHLQQATELGIKHLLEMEGKTYPRSHDIGDLIKLLDNPEKMEDIDLFAPKISEMESRTRYDKDYSASVRIIEKVFPMVEGFLRELINDEQINLFCESHSGSHIQNEAIREDWQKYLPQVAESVLKIATEKGREEAFCQEMRKRLKEKYSDEEVNQVLPEGRSRKRER